MLAEPLVGGLLAAAGVAAWGVRGRSSQLFAPSVWRGPSHRQAIALTFDDGPSEATPELLDVLAQYGARATFFQIGAHARRLPHVSRAVAAAGHEIGNHTDSHKALYFKSAAVIEREIRLAQQALTEAAGVAPRLFRAPFGARWFGLRAAQARHGLTGVMWTTIASDWRLPAAGVAAKLRAGTRPGAILCLHDGRGLTPNPDIRSTLGALRELLPEWRNQGYELVTVSELLAPATAPAAP